MPDYPRILRMGDGSSVFERAPELHALRTTQKADAASAEASGGAGEPLALVQDGAIDAYEVHRGELGRDLARANAGPVYSAGPGGPWAVPTGRVLVRLAKGMKPEMARLTLARKIAAIALTLWKKEERFDAEQLKQQAA